MAELVAMTDAGVDILVEAVRLPVSESTASGRCVIEKFLDGFKTMNRVVAGAAESTWQMLQGFADRTGQPDRLEVRFDMKYSVRERSLFPAPLPTRT